MKVKHKATQAATDRRNAHVAAMAANQGVTVAQVYKVVASVAARRGVDAT
jgi:hypothetical protein